MTSTVRYGGKVYEVTQASSSGYVSVKLIEPRFTMTDKEVFRVDRGDEDFQMFLDMGIREVLEVLDNRGML